MSDTTISTHSDIHYPVFPHTGVVHARVFRVGLQNCQPMTDTNWCITLSNGLTLPIYLLPPGRCDCELHSIFFFSNALKWSISWTFPVELSSCECHNTTLVIINTGSGNGLVLSGNVELSLKPMTKFYLATRAHSISQAVIYVSHCPKSCGDKDHHLSAC